MNDRFQDLLSKVINGMSQDDAIAAMQRLGFTLVEAIKGTRELFCIDLGAAKQAVFLHPAYLKEAEAAGTLQDELIRASEDNSANDNEAT